MLQHLDHAETARRQISPKIKQGKKSALGQFMTPANVARFMASLFPPGTGECRLLDAGAGLGALSCAFLDRWTQNGSAEVTAFEVDDELRHHLKEHLARYEGVQAHVIGEDYIAHSLEPYRDHPAYSHAILNPPYKKINSRSFHRLALRQLGIETVNLYSAFVALAITQMKAGGQIVAIIPRSFCNGPYYRPFRDIILGQTEIRHLHLFDSRNKAFKDDEVLQENLIIRLEKGGKPGLVTVTTSTDDTFSDLVSREYPVDEIIFPTDPQQFIHVPSPSQSNIELPKHSLSDVGINVSTGPVVDFRMRDHLRDTLEPGTVPLLYPGHFANGVFKVISRKPNAIIQNKDTQRWLYPNGSYCVVRRFSSKEEKRRIMASVVEPDMFEGYDSLGFENHLNVFHEDKHGMTRELAHGLALYLNTTAVDEHFRRFNGHTQVNATDLKMMRYPSRETLIELGKWAIQQGSLSQEAVDARIGDHND